MCMTDVMVDEQNIDINDMINNEFNHSVEQLISHIARESTATPVPTIPPIKDPSTKRISIEKKQVKLEVTTPTAPYTSEIFPT